MHKLISELTRLYLFEEQQHYVDAQGGVQPLMPAVLARHLSGEQTVGVELVTSSGLTRALVLEFGGKGGGEAHWSALCTIANAVQHELDLPAPAVSISGTATASPACPCNFASACANCAGLMLRKLSRKPSWAAGGGGMSRPGSSTKAAPMLGWMKAAHLPDGCKHGGSATCST